MNQDKKYFSSWSALGRLSLAFSFVFFGVYILCSPIPTFAQTENSISIQVTPENPRENELVTVSTSSVSFDLDGADFVWKINNQTKKSGKGIKSFSFKMGPIGSVSVVGLRIVSSNSTSVFERYISIKSSSVDLLFQAVDNYTPPFYKGKKLPAPESLVKIVAIPNAPGFGKTINGKDFIYTWKRNGEIIQSSSGFGKQTYTFNMEYVNSEEVIEVSVRNSNGTYSSTGKTSLRSVAPFITFYEKIKNQINLNKALSNQDSVKNPTTLVSVPYFISAKSRNDKNITYLWKINGNDFEGDTNRSEVTIGSNKGGETTIETSIEHSTKFFQELTKALKITI